MRMPEVIRFCPLEKFNLANKIGSDPNTLLHVLSVQAFTPTRSVGLRQIDERAFRDHESSRLIEQLTPQGWHKAVSNSRHVDQSSSLVIANDDGIKAASARHEPADHQFLPSIYPILYPGAAPFSGLVEAVLLLANDSFEALVTNSVEHVRGGCFKII